MGLIFSNHACHDLTVHFLVFLSYHFSHPDKVKISGNDTMDTIANKFVEITKAYKSYVSLLFI